MVTGSSVFILCINTQAAVHNLVKIAEDKGWQVEIEVRTENKKLGFACGELCDMGDKTDAFLSLSLPY
tara:strand:+ start:197 stop:400 length:204 start_codon:yes stop_codon:yes gene_type:complete